MTPRLLTLFLLTLAVVHLTGCESVHVERRFSADNYVRADGIGLFTKTSVQELHAKGEKESLDMVGYQRTGDPEMVKAAIEGAVSAGIKAAGIAAKP